MRIVTWNCCQSFESNMVRLSKLTPDLAIVPESSSNPQIDVPSAVRPTSHLSQGPNPAKCLSVIGFGEIELEQQEPRVPWVLPVLVRVDEPFLLLAIWTVKRPGSPSYATQVSEAIDAYEQELASGRTVLAADFNCAPNTSDPKPHLRNVDRLESLGLHSAYHSLHALGRGEEPVGTLYWRYSHDSPFHCDLAFVPERWVPRITSVTVGSYEDWIAPRYSDHCPVTVEIANAAD